MPIYEYKCNTCGEHTELLQKINDPLATECPHCHQHELKKLVTSAAFHLKGSGWYVTDFKDKPKDTVQKTEDKPDKKADNSKSTSETKAKDSKKNESSGKSD
ncbi:MAG: FmdB family transcriptional regulator [Coxiella sp. (in: Bacteria)]|nr:MAG: FmdB family transcriptional regulator [Coxiella sp. (in: g-proteobacteria)]